MSDGKLSGKVAIITGAGRGIGKAIAVAYAAEGAAVCCAARTAMEIEGVVKEIESSGGRAIAVTTDVTRLEAVENMYQKTVEAFGGVDIIVVNAGGNFDRNLVENSDPENWVKTIDLNLNGAYYCAKAAIPHLESKGGQVFASLFLSTNVRSRPRRVCSKRASCCRRLRTRETADATPV